MEITAKLKIDYADNIVDATDIRNYSKIKNNNIWELISEIEIKKLVSLKYFNKQ